MLFTGSCHCGAVRFTIDTTIDELTSCDCSLCTRKNALMAKVPESALSVLEGYAMLSLYQWNTRVAKHYFCRQCGIYVFHRKRSAPKYFGVNVFCLENFDRSGIPVRVTSGADTSVEDPSAPAHWPGPRTGQVPEA
jgi:hypothetical protein